MIIAFDTETTGLSSYHGAEVFAISTCDENFKTHYWEFIVDEKTRKVCFSDFGLREGYWNILLNTLCNDKIDKVGHNTKFDIKMLKHMGIEVQGKIHDTLIAAKACYTNEETYGLKELASHHINFPIEDESLLKTQVQEYRRKAKSIRDYKIGNKLETDYWLPINMGATNNLCKKYCINDSIRTMRLWKFYEEGMKELKVRHTYNKEMLLYPIVIEMEERGVRIDDKACLQEIVECNKRMEETASILKMASNNIQINLNSPKQLVNFLYNDLHLPIEKNTPSGQPCTDDPSNSRPQNTSPRSQTQSRRSRSTPQTAPPPDSRSPPPPGSPTPPSKSQS